MRALACLAILAFALPATIQTSSARAPGKAADRLYVMDCGHNAATDQARWSPGVNVGKPIELSGTCTLTRHRNQCLLWETGYPDAVADKPVTDPIGTAARAKKLAAQRAELGVELDDGRELGRGRVERRPRPLQEQMGQRPRAVDGDQRRPDRRLARQGAEGAGRQEGATLDQPRPAELQQTQAVAAVLRLICRDWGSASASGAGRLRRSPAP